MFGWFKRKTVTEATRTPETPPRTSTAAPQGPEASIASAALAPVLASAAPEGTPALDSTSEIEAPAVTAAPIRQWLEPAPTRVGARRIGQSKGRMIDVRMPAPGELAFEVHNHRQRQAEIVRIQANGRRVLARIEASGRIQAYTRRPDGTFRLERAPTPNAAILVPASV